MSHGHIIGAVLAGGTSTRMGQDKAMLTMPDGRLMIEHVIDALKPVCSQVAIVGPMKATSARILGTIQDLRPACGPLGGVEAVLASGLGSHYLICACDAPLISAETLRLLVSSTENDEERPLASVFRRKGWERFECLPLFVGTDALSVMRDQLNCGHLALWRAIEHLHPQIVEIEESTAESLRSINTPEEFLTLIGRNLK